MYSQPALDDTTNAAAATASFAAAAAADAVEKAAKAAPKDAHAAADVASKIAAVEDNPPDPEGIYDYLRLVDKFDGQPAFPSATSSSNVLSAEPTIDKALGGVLTISIIVTASKDLDSAVNIVTLAATGAFIFLNLLMLVWKAAASNKHPLSNFSEYLLSRHLYMEFHNDLVDVFPKDATSAEKSGVRYKVQLLRLKQKYNIRNYGIPDAESCTAWIPIIFYSVLMALASAAAITLTVTNSLSVGDKH